MRLILISDTEACLARVQILAYHQPPRLLKPDMLLVLKRTHARDSLEVRVESRQAHAKFLRQCLDPQRLVVARPELFNSPHHAMRLPAKTREMPHAARLCANQ